MSLTKIKTSMIDGSVSGGSENLITDGDGEQGILNYFEGSYSAATRPAGTFTASSGAGAFAISTTTTDPINGVTSFLLTKSSGASRQGRVVERTVAIAREYRTHNLQTKIKFSIVSGAFVAGSPTTDSSMIWYIGQYNGSTWTYTEPSSFKMLSNSTLVDYVNGTFQVNSDTTQIKLIAYVAETANSAWVVMCEMGISPSVYASGTPRTDFSTQSTAPVMTGSGGGTLVLGTGGGAINQVEVARDGDEIIARYSFRRGTSGFTDITGALQIPYPLGYVPSSPNSYDVIGYGEITNTSSANPVARLIAKSYIVNTFILDVNDTTILGAGGGYSSNSNVMTIYIRFKAVGLSSSVRMSDGYDGRVIAFTKSNVNTATTYASGTSLDITWLSTTNEIDTLASWNGTYYTILSPGWYVLSTKFALNSIAYAAGSQFDVFWADSSNTLVIDNPEFTMGSGTARLSGGFTTGAKYFNAGQTLKPRMFQVVAATASFQNLEVGITKLSGSATIAANNSIGGAMFKSTVQSVSSGVNTTVTGYDTPLLDHTGSFNAANGTFTAPIAGMYLVTAHLSWTSNATGYRYNAITKNGSVYQYGTLVQAVTGDGNITLTTSIIYLLAGDTVAQWAFQSSGGALNIRNLANTTSLSVAKLN